MFQKFKTPKIIRDEKDNNFTLSYNTRLDKVTDIETVNLFCVKIIMSTHYTAAHYILLI